MGVEPSYHVAAFEMEDRHQAKSADLAPVKLSRLAILLSSTMLMCAVAMTSMMVHVLVNKGVLDRMAPNPLAHVDLATPLIWTYVILTIVGVPSMLLEWGKLRDGRISRLALLAAVWPLGPFACIFLTPVAMCARFTSSFVKGGFLVLSA